MALATLSIDIVAKLASLEESLGRATRINEKAAQEMASRWDKTAGVINGAFKALAGAAVVDQFVNITKATINAIDALNDIADATGASVENISALEDVALRTGTSMDTVSSALVKFNNTLSSAKPDSDAAKALKAIGLNAEELKRLDPAEALRQTAVALAGFADDGDKARLIQELFGKAVKEVAPFLKDLSEQGKLNATVTKAQAEEAEKFNKQLFALSANISQSARALTSDMLPALNNFLSTLNNLRSNGGVLSGFGKLFASDFKEARVAAATEEVERLQAAIRDTDTRSIFGRSKEAGLLQDLEEAKARLAALRTEAGLARSEANKALGSADAGGGRGFLNPELPKGSVGGLPGAGKVDKALAEYDKLIGKINEKIGAQRLEAAQEGALTEAQRVSLDVQKAIEAGTLKTTSAQRAAIDAAISQLAGIEATDAARKATLKTILELSKLEEAALKTALQSAAAAAGRVKSLQDEAEEIGLTASALAELRIAREEDKAAALEQQAAAVIGAGVITQQAQAWLDEAASIRQLSVEMRAMQITRGRNADQQVLDATVAKTQAGRLADLRERIDAVNRATENGQIETEKYRQAMGELGKEFEDLTKPIQDAQDQLSVFADQAARNIQGVLGTAFEDIFRGKFDNIGKLFSDLLIRMAAQATAAQLGEALFGKGGSNIAGLLKFFAPGQSTSGDLVKSGYLPPEGVQFFANGDVFGAPTAFGMAGGGLGVLGEAGPEAVMPLRRGADGKLGVASAGGGSVTVVINQTVGDIPTRADLLRVAEQTRQAAMAGIADARRRNVGAY